MADRTKEFKGCKKGQTPRSPQNQLAARIIAERPDLDIFGVLAEVQKQFPKYTEGSLRMLCHWYDLPIKRRAYSPKGEVRSVRNQKPKSTKAAPQPAIRASVHSYHGRSRLQPGYYEL